MLLVLTLVGCATARTTDVNPDRLRVLVWNVLHGANDVTKGAEKALEVIRRAEPDLVLMQESYDIEGDRPTLGRWLATQLGWQAYQGDSPHLCVLTRLPIEARFFHEAWYGVGVRLVDERQRAFVAYTTWIDYRAFPGYELRDQPRISDEELLKAESERSSRLRQARALVAHLGEAGHLASSLPLLVGGDWNTPSHLDWTVDAARIYRRRRPLPLPVSMLMEQKGFVDSFRLVHPNPVQRPGITWSPMFRGSDDEEQAFDRIDRLYLKNPVASAGGWTLRPVAATVLPEVWEDEEIPVAERAFPSDHGALLIDLEWERG
ncbi:MAG: endonuclease/exonuclease/phosphatase family protein [Planctomycetota bacterium]|jgi:endonuclease/exonuclease/phosphatase family metal-dependent hydrolase